MTHPVQQSWALRSMGLIMMQSALSMTSGLVSMSNHLMPRMERKACMRKDACSADYISTAVEEGRKDNGFIHF